MMRRFLVAVLLALAPATAGARYYDPGTGRFLTEDPQSGDTSNPITLNEFIYANASPAVYVDPTGRSGNRGADEGVDYTYHDAVHAFVTMDSELRKDCQEGAQNECDFLEFRNHVAITGATLVVGTGLPTATAKAGTALWAVTSLLSMQHDEAGGTGVLDPGSAVLTQTAQAARACANGNGIGCFDTFVAGATALAVVNELVARPVNYVELEPALQQDSSGSIATSNFDASTSDTTSPSAIGSTTFSSKSVGQPFDPGKLARIQASLEKQGVGFMSGSEAARYANAMGAEANYLPSLGGGTGPGVMALPPNASRAAVVEELLHLGQHRTLGWRVPTPEETIELEIQAQDKLIKTGTRLGWSSEELEQIRWAKEQWIKKRGGSR